jgi:putative flippase GtrA
MIMNVATRWWGGFAEKHPAAAEWFRKGGLFVIFSYVVTFIKMLLLMFLPSLFRGLVGNAEWLWPNIPVTLLGVHFNLAIIGNALEEVNGVVTGGLAFTLANLTTIFIGECINFPLQRNVTFKSHGPLAPQIAMHLLATIAVFLVMNLFTCVWNPVTNALILNEALRNTVQSVVTTVVTGGVAMVIIFAVDNKIFAPGFGEGKK